MFFTSLLDFWRCRKRCDLPQGAATEFYFFLSRNHGESGVCGKSQLFTRRLWRQLSVRFVCTVCVGHEYALPWRTRVRSFSPCHGCVVFIRLSVSGAQPLSRFTGLANKVDDTRGDAEQMEQPRRASLFLVDQGEFARPQRGASTLLRVTFLVATAIKITIV